MDGHGNEVAAALFALPTDEEEVAELRAHGIALTGERGTERLDVPSDVPDADIAAAASFFLRRLAEQESLAVTIVARRRKEEERLDRVYGPQLADIEQRRDYFRGRLEELARIAEARGVFAKKKSIATGGGTFGIKGVPAKAKIADPSAVTAWAAEAFPEAVRVTLQISLDQLDLLEQLVAGARTGEPVAEPPMPWKEKDREVLVSALQSEGVDLLKAKIPGVEVTPPRTEVVIKPLPEGA